MENVIITPTFNESENIQSLVSEIRKYLPESGILVVDDNSPDGTGEVADKLAEKDKNVYVLHRPLKNGFGKAYRDGVAYVFKHFPDVKSVCWMDADLSHNPRYIPEMLQSLETSDVVIGSRYIQGGGVENWPLHRRLLSRCGNFYTRALSGLKIRDCTAGFMLFRKQVLCDLDFDKFQALGYSFLIETKATCQ